jgi:hypothetical protein
MKRITLAKYRIIPGTLLESSDLQSGLQVTLLLDVVNNIKLHNGIATDEDLFR